jgi:hypothetical protein
MIESINIIISFLYFLFFSSFFIEKKKNNFFNNLVISLIYLVSFFLIISFFNLNQLIILELIIVLRIFFLIFINKKNDILFKVQDNFLFTFTIFCVFFILSIDVASNAKLGWDAQNYFFEKVINFNEQKTFNEFKDNGAAHYPHLSEYLWSFFWKIHSFNYGQEYLGRIFFIYIYLLSIVYLVNNSILKESFKIFAFLFLIILSYKPIYFNGNLEILAFSLFIILSVDLSVILRKKNYLDHLPRILLTILCLVWTKNESVVLVFINLIIFYFFYPYKKRFTLVYLLIPFIFFVSLRLFFNNYYAFNVPDYQLHKTLDFSFEYLLKGIVLISEEFIKGLFKNLILVISYIFIIFNIAIKNKDIFHRFQAVQGLFFVIFLYSAFLFNLPDVEFQTKASIDRVLFILSGSLLISFNSYLARVFKFVIK